MGLTRTSPTLHRWHGNYWIVYSNGFSLGASLGFCGMFFMAGALLLIFLTILGGATNTVPLNMIYFLQAETGKIPGAPPLSRWTLWSVCSVDDNGKNICGSSHVDLPFDPPNHRNFNTTINVPSGFIGYALKEAV